MSECEVRVIRADETMKDLRAVQDPVPVRSAVPAVLVDPADPVRLEALPENRMSLTWDRQGEGRHGLICPVGRASLSIRTATS